MYLLQIAPPAPPAPAAPAPAAAQQLGRLPHGYRLRLPLQPRLGLRPLGPVRASVSLAADLVPAQDCPPPQGQEGVRQQGVAEHYRGDGQTQPQQEVWHEENY